MYLGSSSERQMLQKVFVVYEHDFQHMQIIYT